MSTRNENRITVYLTDESLKALKTFMKEKYGDSLTTYGQLSYAVNNAIQLCYVSTNDYSTSTSNNSTEVKEKDES
jgi:hypothetical protein